MIPAVVPCHGSQPGADRDRHADAHHQHADQKHFSEQYVDRHDDEHAVWLSHRDGGASSCRGESVKSLDRGNRPHRPGGNRRLPGGRNP
jgi:hypothetical protein